MSAVDLPLDSVQVGDCLELLDRLPASSVDLIFADPPYNLQLNSTLYRPNQTRVDAVEDEWDSFDGFDAYDRFSTAWLTACRRVLKDDGALWVIGTYHNIYRLGRIIQDLGYWILNDVVWIKTNPMPNFHGVRFTNAHETLLWVTKEQGAPYTFNYHALKRLNGGKQMRSDWVLPICSGAERIRIDGEKAHSTQKPEALLYRVVLGSSDPGDVVLDPFFGTGTTGAVAKRLHRHWIGLEQDSDYASIARERIDAVEPAPFDEAVFDVRDTRRRLPRVPFARLLELGLLEPGGSLFFDRDRERSARVKPDGRLRGNGFEGSIHQAGKHMSGGAPCNGWDHWYFENQEGELQPIDDLRKHARVQLGLV
jgi:site-specific DNA-methyltransferase (adenine-specific)